MLSQFSSIFTQMVALFAAIGVGYICKKTGVMDADFDKKLSGLVLSATLPALILASVLNVDSLPDPVLMAQIIGLSVLSYALFIPIAYLVTYVLRIPDGRRGVYRFMLIFGNTGFIGYPVLSAIFGPQTVVYAVVYNIVFNLLSFTFGAWLIASDNEYGVKVRMSWRDFVTPCNIATLITMALESNWDKLSTMEGYAGYIATRPRAERLGSHGLFGDTDPVSLNTAMGELSHYTGNVWTHIISLRREDAARLGYDNAYAWRNLLRSQAETIAENMKIPLTDLRWYAAYHDESYHPHVHMVVYSTGKEPYLTKQGIRNIKAAFAKQIFKHDLLQVYIEQTNQRNALTQKSRDLLSDIISRMNSGCFFRKIK